MVRFAAYAVAHGRHAAYVLALSRLTDIKLFDIKCAWFNEDEYCEFFPRAMLSRRRTHQQKSFISTDEVFSAFPALFPVYRLIVLTSTVIP